MVEPIYGRTYLPRKFKIVVAVPPSNDVDVFAHDLGFIAIVDAEGEIAGWNVTVGGGMGMTHGEPDTYPRTAELFWVFARPRTPLRSPKRWSRCSATGATAETQARAAQIHHRGSRPRCIPRRSRTARQGKIGGGRGSSSSPRPAIATAGARERRQSASHAFRTERPAARRQRHCTISALRRIAQIHDGDFRLTPTKISIVANVPTDEQRRSKP